MKIVPVHLGPGTCIITDQTLHPVWFEVLMDAYILSAEDPFNNHDYNYNISIGFEPTAFRCMLMLRYHRVDNSVGRACLTNTRSLVQIQIEELNCLFLNPRAGKIINY